MDRRGYTLPFDREGDDRYENLQDLISEEEYGEAVEVLNDILNEFVGDRVRFASLSPGDTGNLEERMEERKDSVQKELEYLRPRAREKEEETIEDILGEVPDEVHTVMKKKLNQVVEDVGYIANQGGYIQELEDNREERSGIFDKVLEKAGFDSSVDREIKNTEKRIREKWWEMPTLQARSYDFEDLGLGINEEVKDLRRKYKKMRPDPVLEKEEVGNRKYRVKMKTQPHPWLNPALVFSGSVKYFDSENLESEEETIDEVIDSTDPSLPYETLTVTDVNADDHNFVAGIQIAEGDNVKPEELKVEGKYDHAFVQESDIKTEETLDLI